MTVLEFIASAAVAALWLCAVMTAAWWIQQRSGKSGFVDSFWTFGVGAAAAFAALVPFSGGPSARQVLVAVLAAIWSLRLGSHIVDRNRATGDDPRYRQLIAEEGDDAPRRMFWFLQSQAAVGLLLALTIAVAAHNPSPELRSQDYAGMVIAVAALCGEALADRQLRTFRADPKSRNAVCDVGLWGWSRHPNYFFEWLFWLAYPVIAFDGSGKYPLGWFALAAPVVMYWLLVQVSGIPPLEQHMERTRGAAFRDYRRKTSAFFPLLPRR
jgi:steroid 5-alpha reductase family enzyme